MHSKIFYEIQSSVLGQAWADEEISTRKSAALQLLLRLRRQWPRHRMRLVKVIRTEQVLPE